MKGEACESCGTTHRPIVTVVLPGNHAFRVCTRCAVLGAQPQQLPFQREEEQ